MKIINREEREAHASYIATEGAKGLFYGSLLSVGIFNFLKIRHPAKFNSFSTSIKTCILILPTIGCCAFWTDDGSVVFDRKMHSYGGGAKILQDFRIWNGMSTSEKAFSVMKDNKYKVLIGSWLGSLYGAWIYLERTKVMDAAQRASKMKRFSVASTGVFVFGLASFLVKGNFPTESISPKSEVNKESTEK